MDYEQALIAARNGNAIIFYGAGFSSGLISASKKKLPTGRQLANILCSEIDIDQIDDLKVASRKYLKINNTDNLIKLLKEYFFVSEVGDKYNAITSVPWRSVYTTNYDNSFEVSALKSGIRYESVDIEKSPRNSAGKHRVVHINGFIGNVYSDNINTSFKLTNTSYLTEQFRNSPWSEVFRRDIQSAHAIFFVGYSLYDIDIQEILFADNKIKDKTFFIERHDLSDDELEYSDLNDFGTIKNIGIEKFSNDLNNVDLLALDLSNELIITSFDKVEFNEKFLSINDADVINLLLKGDFDDDILYSDILSGLEKYNIIRNETTEVLSGFNDKENLIIYAGLANGKTIFSKHISIDYYNKGYSIFELKDDYLEEYAFKEVELIVERYPKSIFIIENYTDNLEIVAHINSCRPQQVKLILISRTHEQERAVNDLYYSKKIIDVQQTLEVCLDKLDDTDINKIVNFFDIYGLWGERSSLSHFKKKEYLSSKTNNAFHGILLGLLESPQVAARIESFFNEMGTSETLRNHIIAVFCLAITNISKPTFHMVSAITNSTSIFEPSLRKNNVFQQLISSDNSALLAKSSILAEYVLTKFPNPTLLVKSIIEIAKNARNKADGNQLYFKFYKDLASFRYIQKILPEKGKREALILFYQGLREIPQERNNPHFWLQYAIARLSYPDKDNLQNAKLHLDTAITLAKSRPNYWTDDIETQYARYYLENAINSYDYTNFALAFKEFNTGVDLILSVHRRNRHRKELFRPIILVENFYNKFRSNFNDAEISAVENKCNLLMDLFKKDAQKFDQDIRFRLAYEAVKNVLQKILLLQHVNANS